MNNIKKYIGLAFIGWIVTACSSDDKQQEQDTPANKRVEVSFTTTVLTRTATNVVTDLKNGDEMLMFVDKKGTTEKGSIVKAICKDNVFKGSPTVEIAEDEKMTIYASYPYQSNCPNRSEVPVEIESQTDYLYSGYGVEINVSKPQAALSMRHALPVLAFNIRKDGYTGNGKLQSISLIGKPVYLSGTMEVSSGSILKKKAGTYTHTCNATLQETGWKDNIPCFFCLPLRSDGKDVTLTFKIDDTDYTCSLPKVDVKGGVKYVFTLSLTDYGINLFADLTEEIALNVDESGKDAPGYGVLRITHNALEFTLPTFNGTGMEGIVYWGDGESNPLQTELTHRYEDSQSEHTIAIDTWGADGVTIRQLTGITDIDFSEF